MNGPEHYQEALKLVDAASGPDVGAFWASVLAAQAQTHAFLALVAVQVEIGSKSGLLTSGSLQRWEDAGVLPA